MKKILIVFIAICSLHTFVFGSEALEKIFKTRGDSLDSAYLQLLQKKQLAVEALRQSEIDVYIFEGRILEFRDEQQVRQTQGKKEVDESLKNLNQEEQDFYDKELVKELDKEIKRLENAKPKKDK